jgi:hypothetical protein
MAMESTLAINPGGKNWVRAGFVGLQFSSPYMLEQSRPYINSASVISPNIRDQQKQLGNLKNDGWFDCDLPA